MLLLLQGSVDAGVGSAMCSYNRVNGTWACEEPVSLGTLKTTMGFDGGGAGAAGCWLLLLLADAPPTALPRAQAT